MINLAGNKNADDFILEELYLANIPAKPEQSVGEVPYTIIGELNGWRFRRAWYYYIASCYKSLGLPYDIAVELHERKNPLHDSFSNLGKAIRVYGHCGCLHPREFNYPTLNELEEEFAVARRKYPKFTFDSESSFQTADLRELNGIKYIRFYHIDSLVGLKEFALTLVKYADSIKER